MSDILFTSTIAAFIPIFIFMALLRWLDRYEPEPWTNILMVFVASTIFSTGMSYIYNTFMAILSSNVLTYEGMDYFVGGIVAPVVEESFKGLVVLAFCLWMRGFDNMTDGIIYGAVAGLGFAFSENIMYFTRVYDSSGIFAWLDNMFTRSFFCSGLHALATSVTGAALGYTKFFHRVDRYLIRLIGLLIAIMIHSFWNTVLTVADLSQDYFLAYLPYIAMPVLFLSLSIVLQFSLASEAQVIEQELLDEAQFGLVSKDDVPKLKHAFSRSSAKYFGGKVPSKKYVELLTKIAFRKNQCRIAKDQTKSKLEADLQKLRDELKTLVGKSLSTNQETA